MTKAAELLKNLTESSKIETVYKWLWVASNKYDTELHDGSSEDYANSVAVEVLLDNGIVSQDDWRDFEIGVLLKKVKLVRNMSMIEFEKQLRAAHVFESRVLIEFLE